MNRIIGRSYCIVIAAAVSWIAVHPAAAQPDLRQDLPSLGRADVPAIRIENLGLNDGLAQGSVYEITQDHHGFLWFGTQGGLHRYDGHEFKVYEPEAFDTTSISVAWIYSVAESRDGSIWAGSVAGTLSRLDPATGRFQNWSYDPEDSTSMLNLQVFGILEASDDRMWVSAAGGVARMDAERKGVFERFEHVHDDPSTLGGGVTTMREGPDGAIWVSTNDGIDRIDPETGGITHFMKTGTEGGESAPHRFLASAADPDDPGVFWYGTGRGIVRFDTRTGDSKRWVPFPDDPALGRNRVVTVSWDPYSPDVLWAASSGSGLLRFDRRSETFSVYTNDPGDPNSLPSNQASWVFADRSGTMWVGTNNKGIGKYNPTSVRIAHLSQDPTGRTSPVFPGAVWAIREHDGVLWVGNSPDTGNSRLTKLDLTTGDITWATSDPENSAGPWPGPIMALLPASDGRLWVGTAGVASCDPETIRCRRLPRARNDSTTIANRGVHALYEEPDQPGQLWIGSLGYGLQRLDIQTGEVTSYVPSETDPKSSPFAVEDILRASDGAIWVASLDRGIARLDTETGLFERYSYDATDTLSIADNFVEAMVERREEPGILWLATEKGLDRFDMTTRKATHFDMKRGLANNHMYGLLEDDEGILWMSTNRGISSFDPSTESFRNYGQDDGLRELEFMQNGYSTGQGGMLYFADVSGITAFAPARLATNPVAPPLAFTQLRVNGRPVEPHEGGILERVMADTDGIELAFSENDFSVDFVALHFSDPAKNRYSYRLDGYDEDWIDSGFQRTAAYTNLAPGDYTLRVRAANPDGVRNDEGISLSISVLPPWYRTAWAYALFVVLLGGFVFATNRLQRYRLVRKERARAEIQEAQLRAEAAEADAKALQAENERKKNIERLSEIGKEITASLDFETIFGRLYEHVNDLTDAPVFGVGIWNPDRQEIDYRMAIEDGKRYAPYVRDATDKNQFPVWCIDHREPVFINDVETEYSRYIERYVHEGGELEDGSVARQPRSLMYLPLETGDRVLGVITVQSFEKDAYTDDDLNLLRTLAAYASVALDNADAYRKLNGTIGELRQMQQQLVQQEKMASLGQLTAGIAHEIKNPLNFVNNFAEVNSELVREAKEALEAGDLEAAQQSLNHLEMNGLQITKHGRRADSIVSGMMQHATQTSAERYPVDVNGFVEEYLTLAWHSERAQHPDTAVQVVREYGASVGNAKVAPQEVGRVIVNLVSNAFDALRKRSDPRLTISTASENGTVEIRIVDNGPGVPEELRVKIFEPFYTTKPTGEGTGLGLSMAHDVITQGHGGTMRVEDTPGGGATFVVSLPAS